MNKEKVQFHLKKNHPDLKEIEFYLGEKLISNKPVYVPAYISTLDKFLKSLNSKNYSNSEFKNLTYQEKYLKLIKEINKNQKQYFKHLFQLDETIDPYFIFVFQNENVTEFIWSCWDENNCNQHHKIDEIYSCEIPTKKLTCIIENFLRSLEEINYKL
ncbi:hypothetical protein [Aureivirga sp. CE67]|uniref:hypothetical protein n=1 Tax=Aureivirga sp. CE67 TaxID=1788983 RepID=UPI0018C905CB|nr:hypothetical protein [Aureivirga sp. CE67]